MDADFAADMMTGRMGSDPGVSWDFSMPASIGGTAFTNGHYLCTTNLHGLSWKVYDNGTVDSVNEGGNAFCS